MKTEILITDLTQMSRDTVCVAGVTHQGVIVRPILPPPGISERHLFGGDQIIIRPRAVVTMDLKPKKAPEPPHIEDHIWYQPETASMSRLADDKTWRAALDKLIYPSVQDIFEVELEKNRSLEPGTGVRSLGTVCARIVKFSYAVDEHQIPKFRLSFYDHADVGYFNLPITDLTLRHYARWLTGQQKLAYEDASAQIEREIRKSVVYLRVGITRPFQKSRHDDEKCYVQVNGIYTFPDYLGGKCFADFRR
ncbi:MAG: hypothetical protein SGI73_15900 [Chloroflexota bacterium]|nr:hypothetical protein [Chloroflexota bacterium]